MQIRSKIPTVDDQPYCPELILSLVEVNHMLVVLGRILF